jgi:hypothetical protein
MNRLRQFWHYTTKVFDLPCRLRSVRDRRADPLVPSWAVTATLLLGALLRKPSFLQIESESRRPGWQRLIDYPEPITDDRMAYVCECYHLEDLRAVLVGINRTLKHNKALDSAKIHGLWVVSIDGNEQFNSRRRCCDQCCERKVKVAHAQGQVQEVTEYYHRKVYAQIHGPDLSVVLDLEPVRPGEDEARAAVRMLGRMRRTYGPRFFDVVTLDAWYAKGPTIRAIQRLGWAVVTVLKQEAYDLYKETSVLIGDQSPRHWKVEDRSVDLWEVRDLPFTDPAIGLMRVVQSHEHWVEVQQVAGRKSRVPKESFWRWLVSRELDGYPAEAIWRIGHQRWGVENHAFNELTQHYHLTHCPHHEPIAIVAWLLILILAFNLFELFVRVHGKLLRLGKTTLKELSQQLDRALERWEDLQPLWSG